MQPLRFPDTRRALALLAGVVAFATAFAGVAAAQTPAPSATQTRPAAGGNRVPAALRVNAMWIWELSRSDGGDIVAIGTRAKAAGFGAVYVKSADAGKVWSQFTPEAVAALKAQGLRVCAWQFVYGRRPVAEARAGALAASYGADCLIIDAETSYEGRYWAAGRYMSVLRSKVGPRFPLALTSFPYVDYHPKLPFSVFLGPHGAQVNMPQVYWKDIGHELADSMSWTMRVNRVYDRPILPIGQTYQSPTSPEIGTFRTLAAGYGAASISWWEWAATPARLWTALAQPLVQPVDDAILDPGYPLLVKGNKGDLVRRLQRLLRRTGRRVFINGRFDTLTLNAVTSLQQRRGLPVTGKVDATTWQVLLRRPVTPAPSPPPQDAPTGGVAADVTSR
ncbi:unannotated protein [freshwater metagenome]|uniref:Unannotated protein n=1 Tax=freshwater metagenome TaxID=449393 RepID=A0A6J7HXW2_9ZZZZ